MLTSNFTSYILRCIAMYFIFITTHYAASHLYINWCVPYGFKGFMLSPFLTLAPHCQLLRWAIYNGGICINTCWFLMGGWLLGKFQMITGGLFQTSEKPCTDTGRAGLRHLRKKLYARDK